MKLCPQCDTGYPDNAVNCPTHGGMLSEIRELRPGMLIRKTYRIVRLLGKGGMGAVYLARHELMDAMRAVKFLSSDLTNDEAFTRRFLREGRMLRQVRHKNVVDCGDLERAEDETLFFAMEFVDGPDLRGLLNQSGGRLDVAQALRITRGIAEGLGAAHALGMVHRDIKPDNILMARERDGWMPKIADFGIVATVENSTVYKTTRGSLLTPPYAAPEQWRGTRANELDGRTDLYALGGVLFEMLAGETVFEAENYEGWFYQHQETPPRPPSSVRPEVAAWTGLDALVLRLLAKDREKRPRDVGELLEMLDEVRQVAPAVRRATVVEHQPGRPLTMPISAPKQAVGNVTRLSPDLEPPSPADEEPKKRFRWRGEFLLAAVVVMVFFITWSENRKTDDLPAADLATQTTPTAPPGQAKPETAAGTQEWQTLYKQKRYTVALPLLNQACTGGNTEACGDLGLMYAFGRGVAKDFAQSAAFYTKGCDADIPADCYTLGSYYEAGPPGLTQDYSRASALYLKACNGNSAKACFNLGDMIRSGRGVDKDSQKAADLFSKSCSLGYQSGCEAAKATP